MATAPANKVNNSRLKITVLIVTWKGSNTRVPDGEL
jgi:hypothetical protein